MRYVRVINSSNPNLPSFFFGKNEDYLNVDAAKEAASKWIESQGNKEDYSFEICFTCFL